MMAGARFERVRALCAALAAGRPEHNRRAFVMRLVGQDVCRDRIGVVLPGAGELDLVALRAVTAQEFTVATDAGLDEILRRLLENWAPLLAIGGKQRIAAPAPQGRGEFPAEIGDIVETVIETIGAVGRMRMRCV